MSSQEIENIPLVYVTSLGCSKNWVDTEIVMAGLLQENFGFSPDLDDADVWLINTCGFISSAREETTSHIRRAVQWKQKSKKRRRMIVIAGCICAWEQAATIFDAYPDVDLWLRPEQVPEAAARIAALRDEKVQQAVMEPTPYLYDHTTPRLLMTPEHYAYVKIADGCDNYCSYCAIPKIRGRSRSRTVASVVTEIQNLVNMGVQEIILIGQDITRFGDDRPDANENLVSLIRAIDEISGSFWLRLLYLHPARYPDELTELFQHSKHLIPYLEMPIQHIDAAIMNSMNRKVTPERIMEIWTTLREKVPHIALRTTFIIGYPGETEAAFEALLDLLKTIRFDRVGAFIFQPEPGTPAADLPDTVPPEVAQSRYERLMTLQSEISLERNKALVGETLDVLIDYADGHWLVGRTYRDAPDIDNKVIVRGTRGLVEPGTHVQALITAGDTYELLAKYVPPKSKGKQ